jgi:hypothetical protein
MQDPSAYYEQRSEFQWRSESIRRAHRIGTTAAICIASSPSLRLVERLDFHRGKRCQLGTWRSILHRQRKRVRRRSCRDHGYGLLRSARAWSRSIRFTSLTPLPGYPALKTGAALKPIIPHPPSRLPKRRILAAAEVAEGLAVSRVAGLMVLLEEDRPA